jgi:hypothetical protein
MKTKTTLLIALFAAAALSAHAQTSVPTPQSVAPDYRPPQTAASSGTQTIYTYVAPHATTWDFYLITGAWFFDDTKMTANNVVFRDTGGRGRDTFTASGKLHINMDDSWFFGFGVGYNITEQFSVHGQFLFASPDYTATFTGTSRDGQPVTGDINFEASVSVGDISIRYDFMTGKFRPFIQGSIGFMYIDTGISNGQRWGGRDYYYNDYYYWDAPTVAHTYLTLGVTAGANYYFTKNFFGQLSLTGNWASTSGNGMLNQRINVTVGWNY